MVVCFEWGVCLSGCAPAISLGSSAGTAVQDKKARLVVMSAVRIDWLLVTWSLANGRACTIGYASLKAHQAGIYTAVKTAGGSISRPDRAIPDIRGPVKGPYACSDRRKRKLLSDYWSSGRVVHRGTSGSLVGFSSPVSCIVGRTK